MNVKNIIIAVVGIGITTIFISNCSGSPPISVEKDRKYNEVKITSLVDNVMIRSYTVNRGRCSNGELRYYDESGIPTLPLTMRFSEVIFVTDIHVNVDSQYIRCDIIEVGVDTDQGYWSFNFSNY
jgi:hypothetical protein